MTRPSPWVVFCARTLFALVLLSGFFLSASATYLDNASLERELKKLEAPEFVRLTNVARSFSENPVWMVELGAPADQKRPAMLVVGGIEGNDLVSPTLCVEWMGRLINGYRTNEQTKALLDSTSVYVFPRLNPDAASRFFWPTNGGDSSDRSARRRRRGRTDR